MVYFLTKGYTNCNPWHNLCRCDYTNTGSFNKISSPKSRRDTSGVCVKNLKSQVSFFSISSDGKCFNSQILRVFHEYFVFVTCFISLLLNTVIIKYVFYCPPNEREMSSSDKI